MSGSKSTVAFLGLGNMGGPMAANLVAAGHAVHGFDPVAALKASAEAKGAKVFDSGPAAVAEADVVITSLPSGAVVKDCYAEVLPVAKTGALFIDTSTISVEDAREITGGLSNRAWHNSTHRSPAESRVRLRARWPSCSAARKPM